MKEERIHARPEGKDVIQVGDRRTGPRIQFYLSTGAAETTQFKGEAQGAEQIENALHVRAPGRRQAARAARELRRRRRLSACPRTGLPGANRARVREKSSAG